MAEAERQTDPRRWARALVRRWRQAEPLLRVPLRDAEELFWGWSVADLRRLVRDLGGEAKGRREKLIETLRAALCSVERLRTVWATLPPETRAFYRSLIVGEVLATDRLRDPCSLYLRTASGNEAWQFHEALIAAHLLIEPAFLVPLTCPDDRALALVMGVAEDVSPPTCPDDVPRLLEAVGAGKVRLAPPAARLLDEASRRYLERLGLGGGWGAYLVAYLLVERLVIIDEEGTLHLDLDNLHEALGRPSAERLRQMLRLLPVVAYPFFGAAVQGLPLPPPVGEEEEEQRRVGFATLTTAFLYLLSAGEEAPLGARLEAIVESVDFRCPALPALGGVEIGAFRPFFEAMIRGPLVRLGLVELLPPAGGSGEPVLRTRRLAALIWRRGEAAQAAGRPAVPFRMLDERHFEVEWQAPPALFRLVGRWGKPVDFVEGALRYRLDGRTIRRAFLRGERPAAWEAAWTPSFGPLPDALRAWWNWQWERFNGVSLYRDVTLLTLGDEETARELMVAVPRLVDFIEGMLTPTEIIVRRGAEEEIVRLLRQSGYLPALEDEL